MRLGTGTSDLASVPAEWSDRNARWTNGHSGWLMRGELGHGE